jgi:hypothetical protein
MIAHNRGGFCWQILGFEVVRSEVFRIVKIYELGFLCHKTGFDDYSHHELIIGLVKPLANAGYRLASILTEHNYFEQHSAKRETANTENNPCGVYS